MMRFAKVMQGIRIFYRHAKAPAWFSGRLYPLAQALVFLTFAWINLRALDHLEMTTALPMRDELLARGDVLLGFNWLGYLELIHRHPVWIITFDTLYA